MLLSHAFGDKTSSINFESFSNLLLHSKIKMNYILLTSSLLVSENVSCFGSAIDSGKEILCLKIMSNANLLRDFICMKLGILCQRLLKNSYLTTLASLRTKLLFVNMRIDFRPCIILLLFKLFLRLFRIFMLYRVMMKLM